MKKIASVITLLTLAGALLAQDYIYKKDGSDIVAKVMEITPDVIKYKLFDFQDGPLYNIKISEVFMVAYENGRREVFRQPVEVPAPEEVSPEKVTEENPLPPVIPDEDISPEAEPKPGKAKPAEEPAAGQVSPSKKTEEEIESEGFKSRFRLGFTAGLNAATRQFNYKVGANPPSASYRLAPTAGLTFDLELWRKFYLQSSLLYKGKGDRIDMGLWSQEYSFPEVGSAVWEVTADGFTTTALHYAELSLMPIIGIGDEGAQFQLGAGGFVAYGFGGKEKLDYTISYYLDYTLDSEVVVNEERKIKYVGLFKTEDNPDEIYLKKLDYGLLFYSGLRFSNINLGGSLAWGFQQLEKVEGLFVTEKPVATTKTFTWTLSMTFFL